MKIAFLQETVNQNIGVMYLSAVLKSQGHECKLFVDSLENTLLDSLKSYQPDIVGFSVITGSHPWVLNMAGRIKGLLPDLLVILGGPHPTYYPQVIQESAVDLIARGEAEVSFPELVRRLEKEENYSDVLGLWVKEDGQIYRNEVAPLVEDLSMLPYPDHSLYQKYDFYKSQSEVPFSTIRGCPFRCSFCYNHVKAMLYRGKGRFVRQRSIDNIITEMEMAKQIYPKMQSVILYDDIIGNDKRWLVDFCDAYAIRIALPWFTSIRADLVDEFVIKQLAKANCFCLSLGVETGDEDLREKVLGKRIANSQYLEAARLMHDAGIKLRTSNMLFLPGEDIHKAFKTVDLNRAMKVDFAWAYTLQPYPGTEIYDFAVKNGYLSSAFQFDDIDPLGLLEPVINIRDERKILVVHRFFYFSVRSKPVRKLLRALIHFPPNFLFDVVYYFSLILSYAEYHQVTFWRALRIAWNNYRGSRKNR